MANKDEQGSSKTKVAAFIFLLLGALSGASLVILGNALHETATAWLQTIASIGAAGAAFLAFYGVLKTLDETREMARDQKRIGDAQTRPWVIVISYELKRVSYFEDDWLELHITVKNYGNTPAITLDATFGITNYDRTEHPSGIAVIAPIEELKFETYSKRTLAPQEEHKFRTNIEQHLGKFYMQKPFLEWKYQNYEGFYPDRTPDRATFTISYDEGTAYISEAN